MNELNLKTLNNYCNQLVNNTYFYYQELKEAFLLLSLTGCRIQEIFEIDRWSVYSEGTFILQPQKGNNPRLIVLNDNCVNFQNAIINQYAPFLGRTVNQLQTYFDSAKIFGELYSGNKPISLYLFRYAFIKNLQASGKSLTQIASEMGYTSTDTPLAYLSAKIYENVNMHPPSFSKIGNLYFMNENLQLNDGGSGILFNNDENNWWCGCYYSTEAAFRLLSYFPSLRLPTYRDFLDMCSFAGGNSIAAEKYKMKGSTYWNGNSPTAANFCNLNIRGCGYFLNNSFYNIYRYSFFHAVPRTEGYFARFTFSYLNSGLTFSQSFSPYFMSLRFCVGSVF